MAVYFVTGKLGSGKTLCAVGKLKEYLEQGRQVATNLDINLDKMLPENNKNTVVRLPDKPRLSDLQMLGKGCLEEDESKYGLVVLDELGTWFNSRNWRDKGRLDVIDWFLHARKMHWDIFFIVQSIDSLDGQLVNSLAEHVVVCKRTDRLSLPIIGGLLRFMGFDKTMPKVHVANVHYGQTASSPRVARWIYRGKDLYSSYDTAQVFTDEIEIINGEPKDYRSSYTMLSSFHLNHVALRQNLTNKINKLKGVNQRARLTSGGVDSRPIQFNPSYIAVALVLALGVYGLLKVDKPLTFEASELKTVNVQTFDSVAIDKNMPRISKSTDIFIDRLLNQYRPRLAAYVSSSEFGKMLAVIEFYSGTELVERLDTKALHAFGIGVVTKPYGIDLVTASDSYPVTPWALPKPKKQKTKEKQKKQDV